jgi:hypothetical protein
LCLTIWSYGASIKVSCTGIEKVDPLLAKLTLIGSVRCLPI